MDKIEEIVFFMNENKEFIYLDTNNTIIENYSRYSTKNKDKLIKQLEQCEITEKIEKKVLHYYERPTAGIAHCIAKISTYLRLITKYRGCIIIPNHTNQNVINLTNNIFDNIILLEPLEPPYAFPKGPLYSVLSCVAAFKSIVFVLICCVAIRLSNPV